jgi:hypothetical protein
MEIISNRPNTQALMKAPGDPRCRAIMATYGEANQFYMALNPAMPSASTPEMVLAMKTYGEDAIIKQLRMRTRFMVLRMDTELLNDEEIASIAQAIAGDPRGRTLGYDMVLGFFDAVERGEYELYAFKPRNIISAWGQYVKSAAAKQERLKQQAESEKREAERQQHDREYLRPEEFRKWKEQFNNK